jgi:3-hydroxyisobutyrate dehydrogenase-like beta-hydroxyacid dehydrogenase
LKLAMNLNIAGVAQSLCESLTLARSAGITDEIYFEALHINAGRSGVSDLKEPKLRTNDFSPQFSVKHMAKDLRLVRVTASGLGLTLNIADKLSEIYLTAIDAGLGEEDFIGLIRLLAQGERR